MDNRKPLNFVIPKKRRLEAPIQENNNNNNIQSTSAPPPPQTPGGFKISEATLHQRQTLLSHLSKKGLERSTSEDCWKSLIVKRIDIIRNQKLENSFDSYRRRNNCTQEVMGYRMIFEEDEIKQIASVGLKVGCDPIVEIGDRQKGVMLYNSPALCYAGRFLYRNVPLKVMVFRVALSEKRQEVPLSSGRIEPSKKHHSHVLMKNDPTAKKFHRLILDHLLAGVYHYEYFPNTPDLRKYPSMILPHAVVTYELPPTARYKPHKDFSTIDQYFLDFVLEKRCTHSIKTENGTFEGDVCTMVQKREAPFALFCEATVKTVIKNNVNQYPDLEFLRTPKYFGKLLTSNYVHVTDFGLFSHCVLRLSETSKRLMETLRTTNSILVWNHSENCVVYYIPSGPLSTDFGFPHQSNCLHVIVQQKKMEASLPPLQRDSFFCHPDKCCTAYIDPHAEDFCDDIFDNGSSNVISEPLEVVPVVSPAIPPEQNSPMINHGPPPICRSYPRGVLRTLESVSRKKIVRWRDLEYPNHICEPLIFVKLIDGCSVNQETSFAEKQKQEHLHEQQKKEHLEEQLRLEKKERADSGTDELFKSAMASSKEFSSRNRESQSRSPEERRPSDTPTPNFILPPSFVVNRPPVSQGSSSAPKPVTQPNFSVPPPPLIPMRIGGIRSSFPPVATTTAPVIQNRQPVPQGATSSKAPLASAPPPNMTRPPPTTSLPNFMLPPPVVAQPNPVSNTPRVVSIPPPGLVKPLLGSNSTTGPPGILKPTNAPCPVPPLVFSNISKLPTTMNNPLASTSMEEKGEEAMDVDDDDEEEDGASSSGGNVDRVEKNGNSVSEEAPLVDETIQKALNEIRDSEVMQKFFQLRAEGDRKRIERELNEAAKKDTDLRTLGTSSNGSNGTQTTRSLSNILDSISNYEDDDDEKSKKPETLSDSDYRTHVLPRNDASQMNFPLDRDDRFLNQARTSVMNRTNGLNGLTEQGAKSSGSFNHLFPNIASFQNGTLGMIAASAANPVAQPAPNPASVPATVPIARPAPNPASVPATVPVARPAPNPASVPATVPVARPAPTPAPIPAPRPIRSPNSSPPRADVVGFKPQSFLDQVTQRKASCSTGIEQNQQQISNNNTPSSSSETQASPKKFPKKPKDYDSVDPSTSDARLQESWNKSITSETKSQVAPAKVPVDDDDDDDIIIIEDGEIHEPKNANKKVVAGSDAPPGITARSNPAFRGGRGRSNSRGGFFQNSSQPRTVWMDFLKPISDPSADNYTILIDPMMKEPDMRAAELRELFRKLHKLKTSVPPSSPRIHPTVFLHHSQYELMMNKHHQNSPMTNYFHVFHEFSNSSPPVVEVLPHHTPCDGFCIQIAELQACLSKIHQHRKSTEAIFLTHQYEENQVTVKCMIDNNIKVMSIRGLERFIETRLGEPLN